MTPQNRRTFLASIGAAAVAAATSRSLGFAAQSQKRRLDRIGVQLYTVRNLMRADFTGTLRAIAEIGYKEVEFAGYFNIPPAEVRSLLGQLGLSSPSTHVGLADDENAWKKALDDAKAIGHEFITIPSLPRFDRATLDGWKQLAERFNRAGEQAKAAGLKLAFHNHDTEFREVAGTVPFELLVAQTDPALVSFQVDVYWMTRAGHDVLQYYARHPGRFPMLHVKDSGGAPEHRMVDVGAGTINFAAIFARSTANGTRHYFVEHDQPQDAMATVRASYSHLSKLEF